MQDSAPFVRSLAEPSIEPVEKNYHHRTVVAQAFWHDVMRRSYDT